MGDVLAIVTGGLGIAAGKMQNKGLLIAYMVLAILTALWFAAGIVPFTALTAGCGVVNDLVEGACVNAAGEQYCCFACTQTDCGGNGCLWVPGYTEGYCSPPEGELAADLPDPCDKTCCDSTDGANWVTSEKNAGCRDGSSEQMVGASHGQGTCLTSDDVTTKDQCDVTFGTYSNLYIVDTGGPATYSNAGCHVDTEGGGADSGLCDYTGIIWITIFITLGVAIAGSVMGCCVVCCGNDELGGGDDSG